MYNVDVVILHSHIAVIGMCILASRAAIYGFHGNAGVLRWWSRALVAVLAIYIIRGVYYPYGPTIVAVVVAEAMLSNISNVFMLALACEARGTNISITRLSVWDNKQWSFVMILPMIISLGWWPCYNAGLCGVELLSQMTKYVTTFFSAYVLLAVGSVLYTESLHMKKTQLYMLSVYAVHQVGYLGVPAIAQIVDQPEYYVDSIYLSAGMFFKVGITLSLVAVSSQLVRRSQRRAIWGRGDAGCDNEDVVIFAAPSAMTEYTIVRDVLHGRNLRTTLMGSSCDDIMKLASAPAEYGMAIISNTPSDSDMAMIAMMVENTNVCMIVVRDKLEWKTRVWQPKEMCARYTGGDDLRDITMAWIKRDLQPRIRLMMDVLPVRLVE